MRLNGVASVTEDDPLLAEYPEAQLVVRVEATEVFPNCPRYIHEYRLVERSRFVPQRGVRDAGAGLEDAGLGRDVLPHERPGHDAGRRGRRTLNRSWIALGGIVAGSAALLALGDDPREGVGGDDGRAALREARAAHRRHRLAAAGAPRRARRLPRRRLPDPARAVLRRRSTPSPRSTPPTSVNAVLFASAAIPVYLLARRSSRPTARSSSRCCRSRFRGP